MNDAISIFQVDAFTAEPFAGNPAAVCLLEGAADAAWMQNIAREMNLSETAFVHRQGEGFGLRWFTPAVEVKLCGHATLAAAHTLWEAGAVEADEPIRFHTLSGTLTATRSGEWIELNFPAQAAKPAEAPPGLIAAMGVEPVFVARNDWTWLLELADEAAVRSAAPDFAALKTVELGCAIITAGSADERFDFVSRVFGPVAGIDEDPVTGSAHCCLGPYWQGRLGRESFTAYQASRRGGVVGVRVAGDRIVLAGQAVTVLRGKLEA